MTNSLPCHDGAIPRVAARFHYWSALRDRLKFPARYDYYRDYIRRTVKGKKFIDLGGMWLVNGEFSFYADECGASEVMLLDVMEPTEAFRKRAEQTGSKVKFAHGDIMDGALVEKVGAADVVFCCGVLYHLPNPLQALVNLRRLAREKVLIGSAIIPEGITRNRAVYYPYMDVVSRARWNFHARKTQMALAPYEPTQGYANWFWGMSASCTESLLLTAGYRVESIHYRTHFAFFECSV